AAELARPRHHRQPRVGEGVFPGTVLLEALGGVHGSQGSGGHVLGEERAHLVAEGERLVVEVEVHQVALFFIDFASIPPSESAPTSALCAWAKWCSPKTESMPLRMPIASSHWFTARLVSASPNLGIAAMRSASASVSASRSEAGTTRFTMPHSYAR